MVSPFRSFSRSKPACSHRSRLLLLELAAGDRHRRRTNIRQVVRFGVVGFLNTIVDLVVLNALIATTHTGRRGAMYAVFKAAGFFAAVLNSYLLNRSWTFERNREKKHLVEGSQFLFISLVGAVVNVGSSWWVATYMSPPPGYAKYWPSVGALVGTAFSLGFNFLGYKFWVFSPPRRES